MPCAGCAREHQHVLHAARMVRLPPSTTFCCMLDARHTRIVTTLNPQLQATSNCLLLQVQPRQARPLRFHPQHECGYSQVRNSRTCFKYLNSGIVGLFTCACRLLQSLKPLAVALYTALEDVQDLVHARTRTHPHSTSQLPPTAPACRTAGARRQVRVAESRHEHLRCPARQSIPQRPRR